MLTVLYPYRTMTYYEISLWMSLSFQTVPRKRRSKLPINYYKFLNNAYRCSPWRGREGFSSNYIVLATPVDSRRLAIEKESVTCSTGDNMLSIFIKQLPGPTLLTVKSCGIHRTVMPEEMLKISTNKMCSKSVCLNLHEYSMYCTPYCNSLKMLEITREKLCSYNRVFLKRCLTLL